MGNGWQSRRTPGASPRAICLFLEHVAKKIDKVIKDYEKLY